MGPKGPRCLGDASVVVVGDLKKLKKTSILKSDFRENEICYLDVQDRLLILYFCNLFAQAVS